MKNIAIVIALVAIVATSCKKEDTKTNEGVAPNGSFKIEFEHVWGMDLSPFALNTWLVHPMNRDSMRFATLRYYVSNIKLKNTKNEWISIPETYFIVDEAVSNGNIIEIKDVPAGDYTELGYTIGVDSIRNVSGIQSGALAPSNGMFWNWTTGYIMIKAEGESPNASGGSFSFHLGGFSGVNNIVKEKTTSFNGDVLTISKNSAPVIHLMANVARFRHTLGSLANGSARVHMPGQAAKTMADDFTSWIRFDHLHK
jgi:hypothetical protein